MKKKISALLLALGLCFTNAMPVFAETKDPVIQGKSAIAVDLDTNEIVYTKNIDQKAYPASITKMLTALVMAENKQKTDELKYTETASKQPPYSYRLNVHPVKVGDTITADGAMDALLLFSGNDIAYMIADNVAGNEQNFAKLMNDKAKKLNMTNSHFITPNGLDENTTEHYTTAYDLTKLASAAYKNPWVKEVMAKKESTLQFSNGPVGKVQNRNKLVGTDGCVGGKTGVTSKAGRCLAAIFERDGRRMVGVVMNSKYNYPQDTIVFEDMKNLMNWAYSAKKEKLVSKGSTITTLKVPYKVLPFIGPKRTLDVPVEVKEDVTYYNNDIKPEKQFKLNNLNAWKLNSKSSAGKLIVSQRDSKKEYDLYSKVSKFDIIKQNILIYIGLLVLIILLVTGIVFLVNKFRSRRDFY
ncbi:D-alanyl-D-alanine carboxypeptidase family protein [Hathewaya histolytica]|uniref:D-alanyl-D-alanine carboxypeptidase family protein n=1 Tax=Hathewaya histolytica TaxID=1498 RepID=UPI003B6705C5